MPEIATVSNPAAVTETEKIAVDHDMAMMFISWGPSGIPRLVPRDHSSYGYMINRAAEISHLSEDAVYLVSQRSMNKYALSSPGILGTLIAGGTVVLSEDPSAALGLMERHHVTHTSISPLSAQRWIEDEYSRRTAIDALRLVQVPGTRPPLDLLASIEACTDALVQRVYALDEGFMSLTAPTDPQNIRFRTHGRPISPGDEIQIVGNLDIDNSVGELLTRGPGIMAGYVNDPAADQHSFTVDGFLRTGDLARSHEDGTITVLGTVENAVRRSVSPKSSKQIENAIRRHPKIRDAALMNGSKLDFENNISAAVVTLDKSLVTLESVCDHLRGLGFPDWSLPGTLEYVEKISHTEAY